MISRLKILTTALDVWQTKLGGSSSLLPRQQQRLQTMIAFARSHSPFYQQLYQHLPECIEQLSDLPPVTKRDLMAHFDEWVTDRQVKYDEVRAFIADQAMMGVPYLGRYGVWRTSGTTGSPGIFLHDNDAMAAYIALLLVRYYLSWATPHEFWQIVRLRWRAAFVFATGGILLRTHLKPSRINCAPILQRYRLFFQRTCYCPIWFRH
jgi:phenylacetate-CoA ligase